MKANRIDFFKLTPLFLLLWGLYSVLFRDVIPVASGFGWDGVEYGNIAMNFEELIGKLDSYRAGRIFPGILIYYILVLFNLPHNPETALTGFQLYSVLILFLSSVLYLKIAKKLDLKPIAKWIGFIALFINYPILNLSFYYSVLTDGTVFLFALLYIYAYLKKNNILIIFTSVLSFFTWPTMILVGIVLFVFSEKNADYWNNKPNKIRDLGIITLIILPLLSGYFYNVCYGPVKLFLIKFSIINFNNPGIIEPFSLYRLALALLNISFLYFVFYFIISGINIRRLIKDIFTSQILYKILFLIVLLVVLVYTKSFIENKQLAAFSVKDVILRITDLSLIFPLQYIICHIAYFGPVIILLILHYKNFIESLKSDFTPVLFILVFCLFFSIGIESRLEINFFPIIVIFLIRIIDFEKINKLKLFISVFAVSSLVFSKIWFKVDLPSTKFPVFPIENLDKFPMQSFFLNFGPWQNLNMYIAHTVFILLLSSIYIIILKKTG